MALGARVGRRVGRQAADGGGVGIGADRPFEHLGAAGPGAGGLLVLGAAGDGLRLAVGRGQRRHRGGGQEKDRKGERARHTCVRLGLLLFGLAIELASSGALMLWPIMPYGRAARKQATYTPRAGAVVGGRASGQPARGHAEASDRMGECLPG